MVEKETCALCGLEVGGSPVRQTVGEREHAFCCQGCASVYQLAHQTGTLEQVLARRQAQAPAPGAAPAAKGGPVARFSVQGMHCPSCPKIIVRTLRRQPGVLDAEVDLESGQGQLRYDPAKADPARALHSVDDLGMGYRAELLPSKP